MSEATRTIEVRNVVDLKGTWREKKDIPKDQAQDFIVKCDLSKLSAADLEDWAHSAMVVAFQAKLRSKTATNKPKAEPDGTYKWTVEPRGTRTAIDPQAKVTTMVESMKVMNECQKFMVLMAAGADEAMARQISGCTPELEETQKKEMAAAAEKAAADKKAKAEEAAKLKAEQDNLAKFTALEKKPEGERTDEEKLFMAEWIVAHPAKPEETK